MSKYSPNPNSEFIDEKRKLLYWIAQWVNEESDFQRVHLDVPEISILFQAMGFRLESFDKATTALNDETLRIEVHCPKSGMKSVLIKQSTACKCPTEDKLSNSNFWTVQGCGPSSQKSINTSNTSLLPTISLAKSKIIQKLLFKSLMVINDSDKNNDSVEPAQNISILSRHRSLDTLKTYEDVITGPKGLKRGPSWEVDPKTTPPGMTSSPLPGLCNVLSQISISSDNSYKLVENLSAVQKLIAASLEMISSGANATFVKSGVRTKRVSDITPVDEPGTSRSAKTPTETPRKMITPKKILTGEKSKLSSGSLKTGLVRKRIPNVQSGIAKFRDTPRPNLNSDSHESVFNSRVGCKVKVKNNLTEAGSSGISRFKNMRKITSNVTSLVNRKL